MVQNSHAKYGPIVRIGPSSVSIADKDAIKEALITKDFPKAKFYESLQILNETLFTTTRPTFAKQRRRILSPAFSIKYIAALEPLMKKCFENVVEKIDHELALAEGKPIVVDIDELNNQWALDIIGETAFNGSFNMVKTGHHHLPAEIHKMMIYSTLNIILPIVKFLGQKNSYAREFARKILNERRSQNTPKLDILQQLLEAELPEEDLVSQIVEFITAGSDTTAYSATMAVILLAKNPDKLDRLSKELELEFGFPDGSSLPNNEKLKHLPYLNAVINETLRLAPVSLASASNRVTTEDWIAGGYLIPKGTVISTNVYRLHRSTKYWGDDANEFKPERWLDAKQLPKDVFYPFSGGSRICIGMNFAMQELRMAIATLAHRYHMDEIPNQDFSLIQYIIPMLKNKYKIRFSAKSRPKV